VISICSGSDLHFKRRKQLGQPLRAKAQALWPRWPHLNSRPSDHSVDASFPSSIDRLPPNISMGLFLDLDVPFPPLIWIVVLCICLPHVYNYLHAPLKAIPGPWRSRIAPLHERPGRRVRGKHLLQLHQKYGKSSFVVSFICHRPYRAHRPAAALRSRYWGRRSDLRTLVKMDKTSATRSPVDPQPWRQGGRDGPSGDACAVLFCRSHWSTAACDTQLCGYGTDRDGNRLWEWGWQGRYSADHAHVCFWCYKYYHLHSTAKA